MTFTDKNGIIIDTICNSKKGNTMIQIQKRGFSLNDAVVSRYYINRYRRPQHIHQMAEIAYIMDGEIDVTVNGKTEIAKKGDMVFVPPYTFHRYFSQDEKSVTLWLFMFSYSILSNIMHEGEMLIRYDRVVFTPSEEVRALVESRKFDTKEELVYPDERESRRIRAFLYPVIDEYLSSAKVVSEAKGTGTDSVLKALNFISEHFKENITLAEVADAIGYSESHISHSFSSILEANFRECLNMFRIEHAKRLILTTNMSIVLISIESGFNCERSFHRAFRKSINMPPAKYREKHKKLLAK